MKRDHPHPQSETEEDKREIYERVEEISSGTVILAVVALAFFFYLTRSILLPFVLAGIIAYVCTPFVNRATRYLPVPRWAVAVAALLLIMVPASLIAYFGGPVALRQLVAVSTNLHGAVQGLAEKLLDHETLKAMGETITPQLIADYVVNDLRAWMGQNGRVFTLAVWSFAGFFASILFWVLLGYFLIDAPRIGAGLFWLVPPKYRAFTDRLWTRLDPILRRYFVGVALIVIYASTAAYIGLGLILGLHHAVILALLTGMLEVIPVIGPAASAVIAGLVAVQEASSAWGIVLYALYATALRISIDQFFGPIVLGKAAYVRPVLVIFCFLVGGLLFGIMGVILAVPVALTVKTVLQLLYEEP